MDTKTNVCRLLDKKKLPYRLHVLPAGQALSAVEAAAMLGQPAERVFKTLVTTGRSGAHYVFVIPAAAELDLRKAARAVGEKSIEMLKSRDLLPLTGYVHGGCSPIGMKKSFVTTLDASAERMDAIFFSAGRIGLQVEMSPADLARVIRFGYAPLTAEPENG